ncbi:MAG: F0F1 ATP synthase subunit A [Alphaproteobacteria bacterium]|nr:F0F1 ATP synthase subunit A [Alphaproteobacteria bacterium]MBP3687464.1 F0F1 ATP synthase subunit A [Alphaproteobacteria bacterium]
MSNPMEQFEIKRLLPLDINGYDISFTNSALCMIISAVTVIVVFAFCLRKRTLVPGVAQCIPESAYEFIYRLITENIGKEGLKYFSFIFTLFLFIVTGNLLGLFPYSFTFTSHIAAVGSLSILALVINIFVGIKNKKWGYLRTFFPKGIPLAIAPLIIPIEIISLLSKPFSLTIRLVANMTVGHIMLKSIAGFVVALGLLGGEIPLIFAGLIIAFEIFIGILQAYIYTILSCIYLSDAIHSH